ncbi:MAG TPA: zinc ribbon domain-containing protein [bacterium]|nr:zinc ribbon domain-containing protein [Myxococcales bacterium]OQA58824.1 MAG: Zinc ribbon domain protein [bacterium ADurb.Bin270]HPW45427.1 zinc ribbon domain-containing protein [bacterium]HQC51060.1 zinc ribbon domain-containing protein [bacterium]HQH80242.1 zinc ribbon domain-containing protein [bacterium]
MPIYEYECKSCSKKFEIFQKSTDAPSAKCPACDATAERIISQTSFALKGGGWYKDGYSCKGGKSSDKECSCSGGCDQHKKSSEK